MKIHPKALALVLFLTLYGAAHAVPTPPQAADAGESEYPYLLPIFGKEAYEQGYELPLPVGLGFSYMYAERGIEVTSVRAGINDPSNDVSEQLGLDVESKVSTTVARLDAWLFPFMNIYGFYGHVDNTSPVAFNVDLSGIGGDPDTTINTHYNLDGPTYGGGVILAGGFNDYFMTIDANFFQANLTGDVSEDFSGSTYSARAGWNGKIKTVPARFWLGASYWNTQSTISGSIPLNIGTNTIEFEVDQEPANPTNFSIGGYVEITRKVHFLMDLGSNFDDATSVLVEFNYRFF